MSEAAALSDTSAGSPEPSPLQRFLAYATAFELAFALDDWSLLEPYFAPEARRECRGLVPFALSAASGPAAVASLRDHVRLVDYRFDRRIPEVLEGPVQRGSEVWMRWALTFQREGLADLRIEGDHSVEIEAGRIMRMVEHVPDAFAAPAAAYLACHAAALRAPGDRGRAGPALFAGSDAPRDAREAAMRTLVRCYGAAKSRADVGAALSVCHPEFALTTLPFGIASRDRAETAGNLTAFFHTFPDYAVELAGLACSGAELAAWGTARMSFRGAFLDLAPTGRTAELPVACVFGFRDGLLASERFYFDLASLCDGIGVPVEAMRARLAAVRGARAQGCP